MNICLYKIEPYVKIFVHHPVSKYVMVCILSGILAVVHHFAHSCVINFLKTLYSKKKNSYKSNLWSPLLVIYSVICLTFPLSHCQYPSNSTLITVIGWWSRRYRFVFWWLLDFFSSGNTNRIPNPYWCDHVMSRSNSHVKVLLETS